MQIGEVIREYRKRKNMTQEEIANRLGVTAPAMMPIRPTKNYCFQIIK